MVGLVFNIVIFIEENRIFVGLIVIILFKNF